MQQLPDEIIILIFNFLPAETIVSSVSLVSKYWYENLCSEMDLKVIKVNSHQVSHLVKCPMMKRLKKLHLLQPIPEHLFEEIGKCEFLENLQTLRGVHIKIYNPKVLCSLAFSKFASKLKKIKFDEVQKSPSWELEFLPHIAKLTKNPLWYHVLGMCSFNLDGYQKAAEFGYIPSLLLLAEQSYDDNFDYFKKAAELGHTKAQYILGEMYESGDSVEVDLNESFKWFLSAANQGHLDAICKVAECYRNGYGTDKSLSKSIEWYRKGALRNHAFCQYCLGKILLHRFHTTTDREQGISWIMKSAAQDDMEAIYNLGILYENGVVELDLEKAFELYLKGAKNGFFECEYRVGIMLIQGKGVTKNFYRGFKYIEKAAKAKHNLSCILSGIVHHFGLGVDKDLERSNELLQACGDLKINSLTDPMQVKSDCFCNLCLQKQQTKGHYYKCEKESCIFNICNDCYEPTESYCKSCQGNSFKKMTSMHELLPTLNQLLENTLESKPKKKKTKKKSKNEDGKTLFPEFMNKLMEVLEQYH